MSDVEPIRGAPEAGGEAGNGTPIPVRALGVRRHYRLGDGSELEVLRGVDLRVSEAETVAVVGTSGAGKSTLLHLLGALDVPTAGEIELGGEALAGLSSVELARLRNRYVGFVFQFHHLLREFSALENVMMPRLISGASPAGAEERALDLLRAVGLGDRLGHRPWQLSGGSSSGSRWLGPSRPSPAFSSRTSRPETSIRGRAKASTRCSSGSRTSAASPSFW